MHVIRHQRSTDGYTGLDATRVAIVREATLQDVSCRVEQASMATVEEEVSDDGF